MSNGTLTNLEVMHLDRTPDERVPLVVDDISISLRLGFAAKTMWWLLLTPAAAYKRFEIPKASGKLRQIHAPSPTMKILLGNLRERFLLPLVSDLGAHVTAYRIGHGARDAVSQHLHDCEVCAAYDVPHTCSVSLETTDEKYRLVKSNVECPACAQPPKHEGCARRGVKVHLDLTDFFSNTRAAWIREYLMESVGYTYRAADVLAQLMTTPLSIQRGKKRINVRGVPQGAPTSGDICNLVADHRLDGRIAEALNGSEWVYTRYADDLYFSNPKNLPPESVDDLISRVRACVKEAGWRINDKKVVVQRPKYQQRLLGVTLNRKPGIPDQEFRRVRTIIHRCWRYGFNHEAPYHEKTPGQLRSWLTGKLSWFSAINATKANRLKLVLDAAKERYEHE